MTTQTKEIATKRKTLPELLNDAETQDRFRGMLGKDARSFAQNILTVYNGSKQLQQCDPDSIIAACGISASISLSILPSLGQSCIVPYKDGDRLVATWQIQWKGLVQLAHRTGQYKRVNLAHVYDGQLVSYDEFKGIVHLDASKKKSDRILGYFFFFELLNGLEMEFYWSARKCVAHGLRYSKSFQSGQGKWTEDPEFEKAGNVKKWLDGKEHFLTEGSGADAMSAKTIVKNSLNKWGPLETRIKEIVALDQAEIKPDGTPRYIDTTAEAETEAKTYTTPPEQEKGKKPTPEEKIAWAREAARKQGVTVETFDAWIAAQDGDNAAKAEALEKAWTRVAKKEAKAVDVFVVQAGKQRAKFKVSGAAKTDYNGEDAFVIRDDGDPAQKYYTNLEAVFKAAKIAEKDKIELAVDWIEKKTDDTEVRWITNLS